MRLTITHRQRSAEVEHDELLERYPEMHEVVARVYESGHPAQIGEIEVKLAPPYTTSNPCHYDLKPVTLDETGWVTTIERALIHGVEVAQTYEEPVNKYSLARLFIKQIARVARERRRDK